MSICRKSGFTLIELMIVIVVVAVLAAIAYPSYTNHVQQTRRADATTALLGAAQQLERCFTRFNDYQAAGCPNAFPTEGGFYTITFEQRDATSFRLAATPQGAQATDACGVFTLDHQGNRGADPSGNRCWGR